MRHRTRTALRLSGKDRLTGICKSYGKFAARSCAYHPIVKQLGKKLWEHSTVSYFYTVLLFLCVCCRVVDNSFLFSSMRSVAHL